MSDTAEDLRTFILADVDVAASVGTRCFQNSIPEEKGTLPLIYFARSGVRFLEHSDNSTKPYQEFYDFECVSLTADEAITLADLVRARLNDHSGVMGSGTYQYVIVEDQFEEYVPRLPAADERLHFSNLFVEVINQQP